MAFGVIYLINNLLNGMKYVGQTINLKQRISQHKRGNQYIDFEIQKYGWENFKFEVLEECASREQLNEREKFWIRELNTKKPNGYNLTDGGKGITGCTDHTKAKLSAANMSEKNPNFARIRAPEHCTNLSIALMGHEVFDETRTKISAKLRKETPFTNLLKEMDKHMFSYSSLAKLMGLSRQSVSAKMRGENNFTIKDILKLVEIFNKPAEYLMARDDK